MITFSLLYYSNSYKTLGKPGPRVLEHNFVPSLFCECTRAAKVMRFKFRDSQTFPLNCFGQDNVS